MNKQARPANRRTGFVRWQDCGLAGSITGEGLPNCNLALSQKLATSLDLSWSWSLSAIRAMNSEFVGFPLVLLTV